MKILILTKRQYMGKDLLSDRFGRFWELPLEMARLGHSVQGFCLDYKPHSQHNFHEVEGLPLEWHSINAGFFKIPGLIPYCRAILKAARQFRPDVILTFSDAIYAILGQWLAKKVESKHVIDCYDNFESYVSAKIPFVLHFFKCAVRDAGAVITNSPILAQKIVHEYKPRGTVQPVENGIDPNIFFKHDRNQSRDYFHLPRNAHIMGTAGAIHKNRGIETLLEGFNQISSQFPNLHLVLAGACDPQLRIPRHPQIHYLGMLPLNKIPLLISMLDLAVICNEPSEFANYCFPQKFYEILSCRVPLLAAKIGTMADLLKNHPESLFEPKNMAEFVKKSSLLLKNPNIITDIKIQTWVDLARKMESVLLKIA